MYLSIGVAQAATDQEPLPPDWALAWASGDREVKFPTSTRRCAEEFEQLFAIRYHEQFGKGFVPKPTKTKLKVQYKPASASFGGAFERSLPYAIPWATGVTTIASLITKCADELDPYSRWLGRNAGNGNKLAAISLLPPELIATSRAEEVVRFDNLLNIHLGNDEAAAISANKLLEKWPTGADGKLSKSEAVMLAQYLEKRGYGVEPDVRFGGPTPKEDSQIVVFRIDKDGPSISSAKYLAATHLISLATCVALADGDLHVEEEQHLIDQLETVLGLNDGEVKRLRAHLQWLISTKPSLNGFKKRLAALSSEHTALVARYLIGVAGADGVVTPEEVKVLTKVYSALGLSENDLYSQLHGISLGDTVAAPPDVGPVTVQVGEPDAGGFAIPSPSRRREQSFQLDMSKVQAKLAETASVAQVLGTIFTEEDEPAKPQRPAPTEESIRNLDVAHSRFLRMLDGKTSISRLTFEEMASGLELLPDGALELLNEAAFDLCGDPLCEGEDPIEINSTVYQELVK